MEWLSVGLGGTLFSWALYYYFVVVKPTRLYFRTDSIFPWIIPRCPTISTFYPSFLHANRFLQTIGAKFLRPGPSVTYERQFLATADGGEVAIDWDLEGLRFSETTPTIVVSHGLVGSSTSKYVRYMVTSLRSMGWRVVVFNARGCGTTVLKSPRTFNALDTHDVRLVINTVSKRYPQAPLIAVAFSLGANILTKYLGEEEDRCPLRGAVSISNPFELYWSEVKPNIFSAALIRDLKKYIQRHRSVLEPEHDIDHILKARSLSDFDERCVLKSVNYSNIKDYYRDCSCVHKIESIGIPTLFLNSTDDPMIPQKLIPTSKIYDNPNIAFAVTSRGGHIGYMRNVFWKKPWSDAVAIEYISALLDRPAA